MGTYGCVRHRHALQKGARYVGRQALDKEAPHPLSRARGAALENGAEALFTKPIDFGALRNEIDTCVERAA